MEVFVKRDSEVVDQPTALVNGQEEAQRKRDRDERAPAIGKERRREAGHGEKTDAHAEIHEHLGKKHNEHSH